MCGILGFYGKKSIKGFEPIFRRALDRMTHRGPDGWGVWKDQGKNLYLGHRRLSILDLSQAGAQPMISHNGRWVMIYNGEIYNFQELRLLLEQKGVVFKGRSDTEVLLEGISEWGIEDTLKNTVGMFAFAVWDRETHTLYLARDRFGEKPCYIADTHEGWMIASELKALTFFPFFEKKVEKESIQLFLQHKYVPEPHTIYSHVKKLKPGCYGIIKPDFSLEVKPYWSFMECIQKGQENPSNIKEEEATEQLDHLLKEMIRLQCIADVPVGAFLSGGIDSTLTVAIMQSVEGKQVHTFTIGFREADFDESVYARKVATHLQIHHTELVVTPKEAQAVIPALCAIYDEPFADASSIPTILVSRLARKQVTVSLSGDAGDEIFGGYNRYRYMLELWKRLISIPKVIRLVAHQGYKWGKHISDLLNREVWFHGFLLRERYSSVHSIQSLYHGQMSHFQMMKDYIKAPLSIPYQSKVPETLSPYSFAMATDTIDYLPGDILTKIDRAAMSTSLETRIPFLDHRIVEWAWSLPQHFKINDTIGKKVLRNLLYRYVPKALLERQKQGFDIPVGQWVKDELRDWAEHLMAEDSIKYTGVFHPNKIRRFWESHRDGIFDESFTIWTVLMLQAWMLENKISLS